MSGFKFPDEIEDKIDVEIEGDDIKVEIEDDTPPEDRNVDPLPEEMAKELEKADESEEYSANVKNKFKQYKKAWHDERRAKEAAFREQQEALTAAQRILDENNRLKSMLANGEKELINTYQSSASMELDKAKQNYKDAYDSGDSDRLLEAQEEMIAAKMKLDKAKNFKPTVHADDNMVQQQQREPQAPQMDPKVAQWVAKNKWYTDPSKKAMSRFAVGVHEELQERYGQSFIGTDEYFSRIDSEVHRRFPEEFQDEKSNDEDKPQRTKPSTVVAPAKRSTAPKRVVLTKSAVAIAKKIGITPEQYAREMNKLEA